MLTIQAMDILRIDNLVCRDAWPDRGIRPGNLPPRSSPP